MALGLAGLCAFLNVYAAQPMLPTLQRAFDVTTATAAMTVSAPSIAVALASPVFGFLADRFGPRRVMVLSLFALVVPTALAASAETAHALIFWRFCQGLPVPGIYAVGIAYAAKRFKAEDLGHAMASLVTGNVIGGYLGRTVAGQIATVASWRWVFIALALLTLVGALLTRRLLPATEREDPTFTAATECPELPRQADSVEKAHVWQLLTPDVLGTCWVGFNLLFIQVALFTYVTFYLAAEPFSLGPSALASVFTIYLLGAVVTPRAGRFIDRVGTKRALSLTMALSLVGALMTLLPSLPLIVLGLTFCATATFIGQSAATSHLSLIVPAALRARASGFYLSCYYVGGAAGGVAPAFAWELGGWSACVVMIVSAQLLTLYFARLTGAAPDPQRVH